MRITRPKNPVGKNEPTLQSVPVKSVLLYVSETWKNTTNIISKLPTFTNYCLRRILGIFWPNTINNNTLWESTNQEPIEAQIKRRKWIWIGHTLRRNNTEITKQALQTGERWYQEREKKHRARVKEGRADMATAGEDGPRQARVEAIYQYPMSRKESKGLSK